MSAHQKLTPQTTTQRTAAHRRRMAEKMANLTEALEWAVAEIEGRTRYDPDIYTGNEQRENCLHKAKSALNPTDRAKS